MNRVPGRRGVPRSQRGQALVESVLVLPLAIFMILGTVQLFMMMQARMMAQYAAYKAVRAGSLNSGSCSAMLQAAGAAVLPTFARTDNADLFFKAYKARFNGDHLSYNVAYDGLDAPLVEIVREQPLLANIPAPEDLDFDDPTIPHLAGTLEISMVYWYHLRIPFADWVMTRIFLAYSNLYPPPANNPLLVVQQSTNWSGPGTLGAGSQGTRMRDWANAGHYMFPIPVSAVMRMMTPAARAYFQNQGCPTP